MDAAPAAWENAGMLGPLPHARARFALPAG